MAITVRIPSSLRRLAQNQDKAQVAGTTLQAALEDFAQQFPELKHYLCDAQGKMHRYVNVYLNDEDIRFAGGQNVPVEDGDEIAIVPAIAGG